MRLAYAVSVQPTGFAAIAQTPLDRMLAHLAHLGYEGAELHIRDPRQVDIPTLVALVRRSGLAVPAIGTGQAFLGDGLSFTHKDPAIRRAAITRIGGHIAVAREFQAALIIGLIRGTLGEQRDDSLAWAREAIQECLEIARSAGVPLLLEPINRYETDFLNTVDQAVEFLSGIGAHDVGILFDTFHANIEEASLEGTIASYASRIRHVHTADSNRCSPGSGHLDFKSIILALHAAGYQGWLSAEILPRPSAEEAAARTIAHLRPIVQSMITA